MSVSSVCHDFAKLLPRLTVALCIAGCAAAGGSNAGYLLAQDYRTMTNAQLTAYEQQLSDEIASASGSYSPISVGFGLGTWGSHAGGGVGIEQSVGGSSGSAPVELRDRREAVRNEMRRRGLLPPAAAGP